MKKIPSLALVALLTMPACRKSSPHPPDSGTVPAPSASHERESAAPQPPPGDAVSQGMWWLYQLQYAKAYMLFQEVAQKHPSDAEGPFYQTATDWWDLAENFELKNPTLERRFAEDAALTVKRAKAMIDASADNQQKALAHLYWGGAEGLRGRWLIAQKQYMNAYSAGKDGHEHLEEALKLDPSLNDAYLGIGIYDYYTDVLPGVIGVFSKFMMHGDRLRGLAELHRALEHGKRSRVEAAIFLIEIYSHEEKKPAKALPLVRQLRQEFPNSPAILLSECGIYSTMKDWAKLSNFASELLEYAEAGHPFYRPADRAPAHYFLALAHLHSGRAEDCIHEAGKVLETAEEPQSRWRTFALLRRGQAYDLDGQRSKAREQYEQVLARPDVWDSQAESKLYLGEPYKNH